MKTDVLIDFVFCNMQLQLAHWQASSVTNEHRTLGELYERMNALTDDFAELVMGKNRDKVLPQFNATITPPIDYTKLILDILQIVQTTRNTITSIADEDLANILADMSAALIKAKYLLQV